MEELKWEMTVGQLRLASLDFSHVEYLDKDNNKKKKKSVKINPKNFTDLGAPIINKQK